ncbi:MAG: hypothetical protein HQL41_00870 [Alphaproteobacteria bacterium]|nr:hypothetical protein [Alphaproteobacteria bacterium]
MPQRVTPAGLAPANFAPVAPDPEAMRAALVALVKAEAGRRILAQVPSWKQSNATARAVELTRIGMQRALTPDETAEVAAIGGLWAAVKAIRDASDAIETDIMTTPPESLPTFDLTGGWPE